MKNFTLSTWSVFPRNSVTILAFICSTGHLLRTLAIMNYHLDTWPVTLHFSEISSRISTAIFILSHTYHCRKVSLFYLNVIGTLFSQGCTSFLHCVDFWKILGLPPNFLIPTTPLSLSYKVLNLLIYHLAIKSHS